MAAFTPSIFRTLARYAGKFRTMRNEIRTERYLNSLPADLRKDIGWPDILTERRARR